jgi:ubiquinone/menaquinone biosynthesis C-methylase UbiE
MPARSDEVWKASALAATFLEGVRGAIPLAEEQIDIMLRLVSASGAPVRRFLDLGCGDGVLSAAVLRRFPEAEAVLVDFSSAMLDAARARLAAHAGAVRFVDADYGLASWLEPVAGQPYDAVISGYSIHHQPDSRKREVYREIFELLAPGGVFVNVEHVASASPWAAALNDELFIERLHAHHPERSRAEVVETYYARPDKGSNILAPVETQCGWLREIGFTDVDCFLKIFELAVFGGRRPAR